MSTNGKTLTMAVVLLILSGVGLARDGDRVKESRARAAIARAGGRVTVERGMAPTGFAATRAYRVDFSRAGLTDDELAALGPALRDLGGIRLLSLRDTPIGDRGLLSLATVKALYVVDVTGARATKAGIGKLRADGGYPYVVDNSGPRAFDHRGCTDLRFSPDGRLLAVVSTDATDVWDTDTNERMASAPGGTSAAFSADGKRLAVAHAQGVVIWNLEMRSKELSLPCRTQSPGAVAFSADHRFVYVGEFDATHQYDLATGSLVRMHRGLLLGRSRNVAGLEFGNKVAAMVHPDHGAVAGRLAGVVGQLRLGVVSAEGTRAAWMSDPAYNAVANGIIQVVDLKTGAVVGQVTPPAGLYLGGGFEAPGKLLAVGGTARGRSDGVVLVYEVASGKRLLALDDPAGMATCVALSDDGRKVAAAFECGSVKWRPVPE